MHDVTTPARKVARGAMLVAGWWWCVLLAVLALAAAFSQDFGAAALLLIASIVAAPPVGKRLSAKGIPGWARIIGTVVLMFIAIAISPNMAKDQSKTAPQAASPAPSERATTAPDNLKILTAQTGDLYRSVLDSAKPCDEAWSDASEALGSGDPYKAYGPVKDAKEACSEASHALERLAPPAASEGKARDAFAKSLKDCVTAYSVGSMAFDKTLGVLDGNARPSDVNDVTETMKAAFGGKLLCVSGFVSAASEAGLPPDAVLKMK